MRCVRNIIPLTVILALGAGVACQKPQPVVTEQKPVAPPAPTPEEIKQKQDQDAAAAAKKAEEEAAAARALAAQKAEAEAARIRKEAEEKAMAAAKAALVDINFDFDKSDIREVDKPKLQALADYLKAYPAVKILIEGHCDERGTNEYNLALGEKRAFATKSYLASLGVAEERLATVSFGKERPKVEGKDEASWLINRRAEFKKQ